MIKAEISLKEIDAKSIMGIFSLDVKRPLTLILNTDDSAELDKFKTYLV